MQGTYVRCITAFMEYESKQDRLVHDCMQRNQFLPARTSRLTVGAPGILRSTTRQLSAQYPDPGLGFYMNNALLSIVQTI